MAALSVMALLAAVLIVNIGNPTVLSAVLPTFGMVFVAWFNLAGADRGHRRSARGHRSKA